MTVKTHQDKEKGGLDQDPEKGKDRLKWQENDTEKNELFRNIAIILSRCELIGL